MKPSMRISFVRCCGRCFSVRAPGLWSVRMLWKLLRFWRWSAAVNANIPGPGFMETMGMLQKAGLGEFWGLNPRFYEALHAKYGSTVRFWLGPLGPLWISFSKCDDIALVNKRARGRPALTKMLLSFLGIATPPPPQHGTKSTDTTTRMR